MFLIGKIFLMFMLVLKKIWYSWSNNLYIEKDFIEKNNLTSYMNAHNHIDKDSAFNTPPTFQFM